ncbi:MAG: 8-amino-7-oxononanoate synthase [Cyanobacteria bacterium P01_F01_bin.33]
MSVTSAFELVYDRLDQVRRLGLERHLRHHDAVRGTRVKLGDRWLVNFSSNDYLGLAQHPNLTAAAIAAVSQHGTGSGASRLVTGSSHLHQQLETAIAAWKRTDTAIAFNSGYQANQGVLVGLSKGGDRLFYDSLVHASLRDGITLSRASAHAFPHNDAIALEKLLTTQTCSGLRLIVTESVFSMDGDLAPLETLLALAERHDCLLVVDEAHGVGVFGPHGAGVCAHLGLKSPRLIQVGTCGKALGSFGAYVACCDPIAQLLRNRARSFIYTTALPPAAIAATHAAIELLQADPKPQQQLWHNRAYLQSLLGLDLSSQICPLIVGNARDAIEMSARLLQEGFWVQAIRPPTVPQGTARLRLSLSAAHTETEIEALAETIASQPTLISSSQKANC